MTKSTSTSLRLPNFHTSTPVTTTGIHEAVRKNTRDSLYYDIGELWLPQLTDGKYQSHPGEGSGEQD